MEIEKFYDKEKLIMRLTELAENGNFVFRGYTKQDQLLPNLLRNNVIDLEKELLYEFERYGNQYLNTSNPIDFMSYAQHFGLSTRLLDFTYNPFIALFFALFTPKNNNYTYIEDKDFYYIRYVDVEKNILIHHVPFYNNDEQFSVKSMARRCVELFEIVNLIFDEEKINIPNGISRDKTINNFFGAIDIQSKKPDFQIDSMYNSKIAARKLLLIDPNQSNQRLVMQQGLFMFPYDLNEQRHREILDKNSSVIMIHKDLRDALQIYLDTIGINSFRLMPDLPSVCAAVERKVKDQRKQKSNLFRNKSETEKKVQQIIDNYGHLTIKEIASKAGITQVTAMNYVTKLLENGKIYAEDRNVSHDGRVTKIKYYSSVRK